MLAIVAGLLSTVPAHADQSQPQLTRYPQGEVHAGERVELEWSGASADVRELEILLSVDGGRRFTIRVSPELDGHETRWVWRVPDLTAEHASLRLRFGREHSEEGATPTPEFRITGRPSSSMAASERPARMLAPPGERDWWDESDPWLPDPGRSGLSSDAPCWGALGSFHDCAAPARYAYRSRIGLERHVPAPQVLASKSEPLQNPPNALPSLPLRE